MKIAAIIGLTVLLLAGAVYCGLRLGDEQIAKPSVEVVKPVEVKAAVFVPETKEEVDAVRTIRSSGIGRSFVSIGRTNRLGRFSRNDSLFKGELLTPNGDQIVPNVIPVQYLPYWQPSPFRKFPMGKSTGQIGANVE